MRLTILLIFIAFSSFVKAQELSFNKNQLLVMLEKESDKELFIRDFNNQFPEARAELKRTISTELNVYLVEFDSQNLHYEYALSYAKNDNKVVIAQYNHNNLTLRATPNDPQFPQMWGMLNDGINGNIADADIDADEAWDIETGGTTALGDEIVVAVIDNGFSLPHQDLDFWINTDETPSNSIDDDNDGYVDDVNGWNAYDQDGNLTSASHGTHVAGTIGAKGNNGIGVTGVNWNVKVMAIQGSSNDESTVLEAYGYAHKQRKLYNQTNGAEGAYVVSTNSSFGVDQGQPTAYPLWCAFYDSLGAVGIISAGATANQNWDIDDVGDIPTACSSDYMIAVTNTNSSDNKSNFAGYGATTIDIGAPGSDILSTLPGNNYGELSGTSMATPHIAGAIALMYAAACEDMLNAFANDPQGLALQIRNHLLLSGWDANTNLNGITVTGGRLNLHKALISVLGNSYCQPEGVDQANVDNGEFMLTPNPAQEKVSINSSANLTSIAIMDFSGRYIQQFSKKNYINLSGYASGVYFIKATFENGEVSIKKLVINN